MIKNLDFLPFCNATDTSSSSKLVNKLDSKLDVDCDNLNSRVMGYCSYQITDIVDSEILLDDNDVLNDLELSEATDAALQLELNRVLNYDKEEDDPVNTETNTLVSRYVLNTMEVDSDGRIIVRLPWNNKNKHLLSKNYNLSKKILKSNFDKLNKSSDKLTMYNAVFKEQENLGIIEKIVDVDEFIQSNPDCCFLPHMGVFRMNRDTTKCRVVFLSNLSENYLNDSCVSHNKAMLPGPNLNHKISIALTLLRFDRFLLIFDIQKAFLNIGLNEIDQNKLMFLWFNNVDKGDYKVVAYRNLRLSFGLRCSPAMLMICLYYILVMDESDGDLNITEIKKEIYNTIYMDNGGYTCNTEEQLECCYDKLPGIFSKYKFNLQQFVTNNDSLQSKIDSSNDEVAPAKVKLLGTTWNRETDCLNIVDFKLDMEANTKRKVLKSLGSIYDILNIHLPLINRAKMYMRELQIDKHLKWDDQLSPDRLREWRNICRQVNNVPPIELPRMIGGRNDKYSLHAFTDAFKSIYGVVIYAKNECTGQISYLLSKNKLVNNKMLGKSIPSLEMLAVTFGLETLFDIYNNLTGTSIVIPINITNVHLYTDSLVCIHWIRSHFVNYAKMQKLSVFVQNKLRIIDGLCKQHPVTFHFTEGKLNPADFVTRICSYKTLISSSFFKGPDFLRLPEDSDPDLSVVVPDILSKQVDEVPEIGEPEQRTWAMKTEVKKMASHLIQPDKYSRISKLVRVHANVLKFVDKLKSRINVKSKLLADPINDSSFCSRALQHILLREQEICYPEEIDFLKDLSKPKSNIPKMASKLNLFLDDQSLLRVKCKLPVNYNGNFPILLPKNSSITNCIIREYHVKYGHAGLYFTLKQLRRDYWIEFCFSSVKKVVKSCNLCKRMNARSIKLNQNSYRDARINPVKTPFSYVYMDYFGPFTIKRENFRSKVYVLVITCMWSRAISLQLCDSLSVKDFLRAVQLHVFNHGIFQYCVSDLGSQLVAGSKVITDWLNDIEVVHYFDEFNLSHIKFTQFAKGNSALGSLVESCVKQSKNLIYKSIRNNVLSYNEFYFVIKEVNCIVNKRPIAFQNSLRDTSVVPPTISPEMLIYGREIPSINVIPTHFNRSDPDWSLSCEELKVDFGNLQRVRDRIKENYHGEFLQNLIDQAVDKPGRYKHNHHARLKPNDIVLLIEPFGKPCTYPLGIVKTVEVNSIGEVTAAKVLKGKTKEVVYRHSTSLKLLIPAEEDAVFESKPINDEKEVSINSARPPRNAAKKAKARISNLLDANLV